MSGVRAVTLHDPATVHAADLSAQFYLTEADIGKNRAEACVSKLQDLNSSVRVSAASGMLTPEYISHFQVSTKISCSRRLEVRSTLLIHSAAGSGSNKS